MQHEAVSQKSENRRQSKKKWQKYETDIMQGIGNQKLKTDNKMMGPKGVIN